MTFAQGSGLCCFPFCHNCKVGSCGHCPCLGQSPCPFEGNSAPGAVVIDSANGETPTRGNRVLFRLLELSRLYHPKTSESCGKSQAALCQSFPPFCLGQVCVFLRGAKRNRAPKCGLPKPSPSVESGEIRQLFSSASMAAGECRMPVLRWVLTEATVSVLTVFLREGGRSPGRPTHLLRLLLPLTGCKPGLGSLLLDIALPRPMVSPARHSRSSLGDCLSRRGKALGTLQHADGCSP